MQTMASTSNFPVIVLTEDDVCQELGWLLGVQARPHHMLLHTCLGCTAVLCLSNHPGLSPDRVTGHSINSSAAERYCLSFSLYKWSLHFLIFCCCCCCFIKHLHEAARSSWLCFSTQPFWNKHSYSNKHSSRQPIHAWRGCHPSFWKRLQPASACSRQLWPVWSAGVPGSFCQFWDTTLCKCSWHAEWRLRGPDPAAAAGTDGVGWCAPAGTNGTVECISNQWSCEFECGCHSTV